MSPKHALCKDTLNKYGWEADDITVGDACRALHLERHGVWADMTTLRVRRPRLSFQQDRRLFRALGFLRFNT
jgi:hypothetical protein